MDGLPKVWRYYGNYASGNYGLHCLAFRDADGNEFYYSYDTLVAFKPAISHELFCMKNYWSTTTGKHLNAIEPDKNKRLDKEEFYKIFAVTFPRSEYAKM